MPIVSATNTYSTINADGTPDQKSLTVTIDATGQQHIHLKFVRDNSTLECLLTHDDATYLSTAIADIVADLNYKPTAIPKK